MKKINNNLPRGGAEWGRALRRFLSDNIVPIMFVLICAYCIPRADLSWNYLLNEGMTRLGRNAFLILSLLIPVMAGMGMNFGMTLGAMAGQIGLIFAADWQVWGIPGLILAAIISIPISVLLGIMIGKLLNRAKGREMITSYMIAFAMDGVYQFFVLFMMGPVIPIIHNTLKLPRGYGIRNTVSLLNMRQSLDNLLAVSVGGVKIPVLTLIIIAAACLFILWFRRTKLGQDMRAVGQDMEVARDAGINVERTRVISMVISTVFAGFGMIIYLQNVGNFPTYTAHTQIGMFSIAALLVGGAKEECELYVTLEPCPMCAGAIVQARIPKVYIGSMNPKAGCAGSVLNLLDEKGFNHQVETEEGLLGEECSMMLKEFFKELREKRKKKKEEKAGE